MITLKFALKLADQKGSGCPHHGNTTAPAAANPATRAPDHPRKPAARWKIHHS
jgi:hypothetical protein